MKFTVIALSLLLFLNGSWSYSASLCQDVFLADVTPLTSIFKTYRSRELQELRKSTTGRWVQLENGKWVHYRLFGEKGPVKIHIEGLGGRIESSLSNQVLKEFTKKGRVLVIELEGQGAREVHRRIALENESKESTRQIDYGQNINEYREALHLILKKNGIRQSQISSWSGHSFGGLSLSGFMKQNHVKKPIIQFLASGIANFNHRFISSSGNSQINFWGQIFEFFVPNADKFTILSAMESFKGDPLFNHIKEDPVQLEAAIGLTLGAGQVDAVNHPVSFPKGTRVQIFTGEKDLFVFAMLHWEFAQASLQAGLKTTLVMVENVGHYLPQELNPAQTREMLRIEKNPDQYMGYYFLTTKGRLQPITEEAALQRYKESSWEAWLFQKDSLNKIFGNLGQSAQYPKDWN